MVDIAFHWSSACRLVCLHLGKYHTFNIQTLSNLFLVYYTSSGLSIIHIETYIYLHFAPKLVQVSIRTVVCVCIIFTETNQTFFVGKVRFCAFVVQSFERLVNIFCMKVPHSLSFSHRLGRGLVYKSIAKSARECISHSVRLISAHWPTLSLFLSLSLSFSLSLPQSWLFSRPPPTTPSNHIEPGMRTPKCDAFRVLL